MLKGILTSLILLLLIPVSVYAQQSVAAMPVNDSLIYPVPRPNVNSFLGQKHDYSVVFRGNGEAVISVRVALTNSGSDNLKEVDLRIPDYISPSDLIAFQVIREGNCIRYTEPQTIGTPIYNYNPSTCAEFDEPDYFQPYRQNKYQKANAEISGDTLKVMLPVAIAKEKSGSFFVYFRAVGFAKKDLFGSYNFDFETLKVNESIQNLQVGISTDSDLIIKGAAGEVDYRFEDQSRNLSSAAVGEKAMASPAIDSFYNQIGYGSINKTASGLAPLESYKVTGAYAKARLMLYAKEISVGVFALLVSAVVIFMISKIVIRKFKDNSGGDSQDVKEEPKKSGSSHTFLLAFLASIISAVLVSLYTVALLLIGQVINNGYYYGPQNSQTFIWLILIVISFAVYAFLIFAPSFIVGMKRTVGWGFATLGLTILWLVLMVSIVGLVIFLGGMNKDQTNPPVPYLMEQNLKSTPMPL